MGALNAVNGVIGFFAFVLLVFVGSMVVAWKLPSTRPRKVVAVIAVPVFLIATYTAWTWYTAPTVAIFGPIDPVTGESQYFRTEKVWP